MSDITVKYNKLNKNRRQEANDFLDFLLSRQKNEITNMVSAYKQKILSVSTWSDEDCKIFEENQKIFSQWKTEEW